MKCASAPGPLSLHEVAICKLRVLVAHLHLKPRRVYGESKSRGSSAHIMRILMNLKSHGHDVSTLRTPPYRRKRGLFPSLRHLVTCFYLVARPVKNTPESCNSRIQVHPPYRVFNDLSLVRLEGQRDVQNPARKTWRSSQRKLFKWPHQCSAECFATKHKFEARRSCVDHITV